MKVEDMINCSFTNWYPKFKKCTIKSEVLELPSDVLEYLLDAGTLVLPHSSYNIHATTNTTNSNTNTTNTNTTYNDITNTYTTYTTNTTNTTTTTATTSTTTNTNTTNTTTTTPVITTGCSGSPATSNTCQDYKNFDNSYDKSIPKSDIMDNDANNWNDLYDSSSTLSDHEEDDWIHDECLTVEEPCLEEFSNRMRAAVGRLGGEVFPKLNWSAPMDAAWVSLSSSLRCLSPADVFLILKSSAVTSADLLHPFQGCSNHKQSVAGGQWHAEGVSPALVLRRWTEINPSTEFRGFVRDGKFIGLCQRDTTQHYACVAAQRRDIVVDCNAFWRANIANTFPLPSYVFDVVRVGKGKVLLLDFSPLSPEATDALLFEWEDLTPANPPPPSSPPPPPATNGDLGAGGAMAGESAEEGQCPLRKDAHSPLRRDAHSLDASNRVQDQQQKNDDQRQKDDDEQTHRNNDEQQHSKDAIQSREQHFSVPEFRFISEPTGVQPSPNMKYGLPVDFLHLRAGEDPFKLADFLDLKMQPKNGDWSSSEDED